MKLLDEHNNTGNLQKKVEMNFLTLMVITDFSTSNNGIKMKLPYLDKSWQHCRSQLILEVINEAF